ncbi:MAG TPA: hypothetical protein EYG89_02610 [Bacteroidia bacterium]|nr:hypothetical protein [Bacteroidia bacterium]
MFHSLIKLISITLVLFSLHSYLFEELIFGLNPIIIGLSTVLYCCVHRILYLKLSCPIIGDYQDRLFVKYDSGMNRFY